MIQGLRQSSERVAVNRMSRAVAAIIYAGAVALGAVTLASVERSPARAQEAVKPSAVDAQVRQDDFPNLVYGDDAQHRSAPLVIFMPGTGGTSEHGPELLLNAIAGQGYRVIYLTYDDELAGDKLCFRAPPDCAARFRASRVFGDAGGPAPTPVAEAIVPRLVGLLRYLAREDPDVGWNDYVTADGPVWSDIVVSGLSQGAGMAAFIAKRYDVRRVVLFSSPWDAVNPGRRPAPWLSEPSATPPDRWWAERHVRENTTELIAHAYAALGIPPDHILLFDGPAPAGAIGENPYHGSIIRLQQYQPQWLTMYGSASAAM